MKVSLQLAGGSSYGCGDPEGFAHIHMAMAYAEAFWANRGRIATPCAEDCVFRLYKCPPDAIIVPYPDEIWRRGPKGGLVRKRC